MKKSELEALVSQLKLDNSILSGQKYGLESALAQANADINYYRDLLRQEQDSRREFENQAAQDVEEIGKFTGQVLQDNGKLKQVLDKTRVNGARYRDASKSLLDSIGVLLGRVDPSQESLAQIIKQSS